MGNNSDPRILVYTTPSGVNEYTVTQRNDGVHGGEFSGQRGYSMDSHIDVRIVEENTVEEGLGGGAQNFFGVYGV